MASMNSVYVMRWRKKHKEKYAAYQKRYRDAHKEKMKEYWREYYTLNKDRIKQNRIRREREKDVEQESYRSNSGACSPDADRKSC